MKIFMSLLLTLTLLIPATSNNANNADSLNTAEQKLIDQGKFIRGILNS